MVDIYEISIEEFKKNLYDQYLQLFPEEEQREWIQIEGAYQRGIEKFYKIVLEEKTIGFFMLEKLKDSYPFYLDYFAIFQEYQNKGYGSFSMAKLIHTIIGNDGLIAEIEKENKDNQNTIRRFRFYSKLGFQKLDSEYLLYHVVYTPIFYPQSNSIVKEEMDRIFFDYYSENCGEDEVQKNCRIIQ